MDLLIEKGDKRTYLSRYKVITTSFEESSPSVKRNNTQIQYRNGNVDFGGWNEAKTIDYVGYYRADDLEDEEYLRERIYALLSDPDGYYVTQLKNDNDDSFERPGETSGDYFDKQVNRPSHKRFYVYASSLESELVGSYGGHVLYKISATFTTMKLPYSESVPRDLYIKPITDNSAVGTNLIVSKTIKNNTTLGDSGTTVGYFASFLTDYIPVVANQKYTITVYGTTNASYSRIAYYDSSKNFASREYDETISTSSPEVIVIPSKASYIKFSPNTPDQSGEYKDNYKIEKGSVATDWCPNPSDSGYNEWYLNMYYNTKNLVIPYAGTVPCNQLEQGFAIEFTAKEAGSKLFIDVNGTELTYNGQVYSGDVIKLSGYEYTKNDISIVKYTNKAYFRLLPGVTNKISSSIKGAIRILDYQDLYA